MPSTNAILDGLERAANGAIGIAIAWHVVLAIGLLALAAGWRPRTQTVRVIVAAPFVSVASVALAFDNWFNATAFAIIAIGLTLLATRPGTARIPFDVPRILVGGAVVAYAWVYPHFLRDPNAYLVAAPVGVLPCPTLALALGIAIAGGGLQARAWSLALAGVGLVYGLFGMLRLGVLLDVGLVIAAVTLGAHEICSKVMHEDRRVALERR
jgi:hypothetical protein